MLLPFAFFFLKVDKLVESEEARLEEKKEAEYKPVVMGKSAFFSFVNTRPSVYDVLLIRLYKKDSVFPCGKPQNASRILISTSNKIISVKF